MRLLQGLLLSLLCVSIAAVNEADFKKCDEASFCKRNREYASKIQAGGEEASALAFNIVPASLTVHATQSRLTAQLVRGNGDPLSTLELSVDFYKDRTIRATARPLRGPPRYEVQNVIIGKLQQATNLQRVLSSDGGSASSNEKETIVTFDPDVTVRISHSPFEVLVFSGDSLLVKINSQQLLNIEVSPTAQERQEIGLKGQSNEKLQDQSSDDGVVPVQEDPNYSETWRQWTDTRPKGPASIGLDFEFVGSDHVYGIPEHASAFNLKSTRGEGAYKDPYRLYNLDVFEYILDSPMALYGSIPFLISHRATAPVNTVGLFWVNAAESWVDISRKSVEESTAGFFSYLSGGSDDNATKMNAKKATRSHWISESGVLDFYLFLGPTLVDVYRPYFGLTGYPALPQEFAIAYHQCRWNYNDQEDVANVDATFDENDIPYDVLWLDIEHTDGKRYFTWDSKKFPDPVKMQNELAAKGRKMVTIIDPHIKVDGNFKLYSEAKAKGVICKTKDNNDFEGNCWPGNSVWYDYLNEQAREVWASMFEYSNYPGSTPSLFTWNDMNEPSVFSGPEISMPRDNLHLDGSEHRDVHNIYGFHQHWATNIGQLKRNEKKVRPFVLSRSFFAGSQRFGPIWTGDNMAKWDHLQYSNPMLLSVGIAGLPFVGADVGGFFGNPEADLFVRWYQAGAFQPFFRGHAHIETRRREPWVYGEPYTSLIRKAIRRRYALLPLYYSLFKEASTTGLPIMRPLWVEFPGDEKTLAMEDQFLVGKELLVKPVTVKDQASTIVYLPEGHWYDFDSFRKYVGPSEETISTDLSKIPVFIRGGSIFAMRHRVRRSYSLMKRDPYTLFVAVDKKNSAEGFIYVDDGESFDFESGAFAWKKLSFDGKSITSQDKHSTPKDDFLKDYANLFVERITIIGLIDIKTSKATVTSSTDSLVREAAVEVETVENGVSITTIRLPNVSIVENWTISLE